MSAPDTSLPQLPQLQQPQPIDSSAMTQVSPNLQPRPKQQQWKASGLPGLAMSIIQQVQARKKRELDSTMNTFVQNSRGLQEAQSQMEQAKQANKQALTEFQTAKTPEAKQAAQQKLIQSAQALQKAQQSLQVSQTNLKDMFNGPKADKHVKMLSKAFGVDDKNADSPERKSAIDAIKKQQQVDEKTARFMSMLPQRQQLTPQAQGQAMAVQAGVAGKPATGGQVLNYRAREEAEAGKDQRAQLKNNLTAALNGQKYNDQGQLVPMSPEEISKNPILSAKIAVNQTRQQLLEAQAVLQRMRASALPEQVKLQEARIAALQGNLMMRQKEFGIKVQEEERRRLETSAKIGEQSNLTTPEGGTVDIGKLTGGRPLQSWAQQTVVMSEDRLQQVNSLIEKLEPLKDNNTAGYLAMDRLGYSVGIASENGELGAEISNIELQRVVNASTILKGSSRAWSALSAAMIHTPNAWVDSPKLMYQKLQTIQKNLQDMQTDAIMYGQKNQRSTEMPSASKPKQPSAPSGNTKIVVSAEDMK